MKRFVVDRVWLSDRRVRQRDKVIMLLAEIYPPVDSDTIRTYFDRLAVTAGVKIDSEQDRMTLHHLRNKVMVAVDERTSEPKPELPSEELQLAEWHAAVCGIGQA